MPVILLKPFPYNLHHHSKNIIQYYTQYYTPVTDVEQRSEESNSHSYEGVKLGLNQTRAAWF